MTLKDRMDKVERDIRSARREIKTIKLYLIVVISGLVGGPGFTEFAKTVTGSPWWVHALTSMLSMSAVLISAWLIVTLIKMRRGELK